MTGPYNAKNRLLERLKDLGWPEVKLSFTRQQLGPNGGFRSTATLHIEGVVHLQGEGQGHKATDAEIAASRVVLERLEAERPEFFPDWEGLKVQAQAGDALVKLAVYLDGDDRGAMGRSLTLQGSESNAALSVLFEPWREEDPTWGCYGPGLSTERRALLVESRIWRMFGARVLAPEAAEVLGEIRAAVGIA